MDESRFLSPGPMPIRRPQLPNSSMGAPVTLGVVSGTVNAAGLNQPSTPAFGSFRGTPGTQLATLNVLNTGGSTLVRMSVGNPPRRVRMPFTTHPPSTRSATPPPDMNFLPGPKGSS